MTVSNARLPVNIESGAVGGPLFKTTILIAASGDEQRIIEWDHARGEWDIGYGIRSITDIQTVLAFFRSVRGRAYSWRFKDWSDYTTTTEQFGTGNGSETEFQLTKTYNSYNDAATIAYSFVRDIKMPRTSPITITDNGSTVNPSDYDLLAGGIISFDTPPVNAHVLRWTGEFDCAVRFDVDKLPISMVTDGGGTVRGIRIVEVLDSA